MNDRFSLQTIRDHSQRCIKCGECRSVCPVFRERRDETYVARSKVSLIEAAMLDQHLMSSEFDKVIENCILCLSCVANCGNKVRVDKIVIAARAKRVSEKKPAFWKRWLFRFLKNKNQMQTLSKSMATLQKTLVRRLPKHSGLLLKLPLPFKKHDFYIPLLPKQPFQAARPELNSAANRKASVIFFTGCATNHIYPAVGNALVKVLNTLDVDVIVPKEQLCCGAPAQANGDLKTAQFLAAKNLEVLAAQGRTHPVIVPCGTCGKMLKHDYQDLTEPNSRLRGLAQNLSPNVFDIADYLVNRIGIAAIRQKIRHRVQGSVTYHEPCHLGKGLEITAEPRKLLSLICASEIIEMDHADRCCGFGGTYSLSEPLTSNAILARKMANIAATQARTVVTGCPGCMMQLMKGTAIHNTQTDVVHLIELLAGCLRN